MKVAAWLAAVLAAAAGSVSVPVAADEPLIIIGLELGLSPPQIPAWASSAGAARNSASNT